MITQNPYGHFRATKPGYGDPEPCSPVSTLDPQENVDACLSCPLPECRPGLAGCSLRGKKSNSGRRLIGAELLRRDGAILDMLRAGYQNEEIVEALGVKYHTLMYTKRRLRERGEIA